MKKLEIYIIEMLLFISIIMFNIIYKSVLFQSLSIIMLTIYSIVRFGIMKDNNYVKSTVIKMVISCILVYLTTIYLLGLILGFNKTPLAFSMDYFVKVISFDAIVIVSEEILRYIIARNTQHKKLPLIIYTVILIILNIIVEINGYNLRDKELLFIFITTVVVPAISMQAICSYLTYKVSYIPSLILNLVISLYQYVFPIVPKLGYYLYSVTNVALPYIIYYTVSKLLHYKDKVDIHRNKMTRNLVYVPVFIFLIVLVMLVSGIFTHKLIAIGSNSMAPTYEKGDAVVYKKINITELKVGEILAFKMSGRIITHRIIKIYKEGDNYFFNTKGDANNAPDAWVVKDDDVLGVVNYKIKYIGYPTLWFNEMKAGKEKE